MSVTARGGYQIVDLKNVPITTNGVIIPGVYEQASNAEKKALMFTNLTIDNNGQQANFPIQFSPALINITSGVVSFIYDALEGKFTISISSDDTVKLLNVA